MAKRKRRNFTPEFKAKVVLEVLSGESSQAELCRKPYNLSENQLSKCKQQVVENVASLFVLTDKHSSEEELRDEIETLVPCGIRNMDIGVSQNSYCVWDTLSSINVLPD